MRTIDNCSMGVVLNKGASAITGQILQDGILRTVGQIPSRCKPDSRPEEDRHRLPHRDNPAPSEL